MRIILPFLAVLATSLLCGCQTMGHIQFSVPPAHELELIDALRKIASSYSMDDKTTTSAVADTLVYFLQGETSFTMIGARRHGDRILVDLAFRFVGRGGNLFRKLEPELMAALSGIYGSSAVTITKDQKKIVPGVTSDG